MVIFYVHDTASTEPYTYRHTLSLHHALPIWMRARYERSLADRPWKQWPCASCHSLSIDVFIFRASNRNKRRGIHNLGIYKALIDSLPASSEHHENIELLGDTSSSKSGTHRSVIRRSRVRTTAVCGD